MSVSAWWNCSITCVACIGPLMDWLERKMRVAKLLAVGHRVVHGGMRYTQSQQVTAAVLAELRRLSPYDPEHLPAEIGLIEAFTRRYPDLAQIACFDTAFHRDMPRVARLLPIPRRYAEVGIQRYGFHGLSYSFLMKELAGIGGDDEANGRVILAHLGNVIPHRAHQHNRIRHRTPAGNGERALGRSLSMAARTSLRLKSSRATCPTR